MTKLNERALELANALMADADTLGVAISTLECGARIIDCGVKTPGSVEAGRRLAEICLAGLGTVTLSPARQEVWPGQSISVATADPVAACMASQYAGWQITGERFFAMGSGPMRAAACREEIFKEIGFCEKPSVGVGVLETGKLPPDATCRELAAKCGIDPRKLTLLVARTASLAGTVQIVARSVETALHKLHTLGFDLRHVLSGTGSAPMPPPCEDDMLAIGRTNDAILYGGAVTLEVDCGNEAIEQFGPQTPSSASPDFGRPFSEIFAGYDNDFYRIDPLLFSPARIIFENVRDGGSKHEFGALAPHVLAKSFGAKK